MSEDPRNDWELVYRDAGFNAANCAGYGNGNWVVGPTAATSTVVTASSASGPWASSSLGTTATLFGIAYDDGIWVLGRNGGVFTATDPTGTWTSNTDVSFGAGGSYFAPSWIGFDGTRWAVGSQDRGVYTASDPASTWTFRSLFTGSGTPSSEDGRLLDLAYIGDIWVASVRYRASPGVFNTRLYSTTDPTGSWALRYTFDPDYVLVRKWEDVYVAISAYGAETSDSLDGTWTSATSESPTAYGDGDYVGVVYEDYTGSFRVASSLSGAYQDADTDSTYDDIWAVVYGGGEWLAAGNVRDEYDDSGELAIWTPTSGGTGWGMLL